MSDWLIEEGIGEHRAARIVGDRIVAARVRWPGHVAAGDVAAGAVMVAKLASRQAGSKRGVARLDDGSEVLVDRLPREASEGAPITIEVTRAAIGEAGRRKPAQARPTDKAPAAAPGLADTLRREGHAVTIVRRFPADWDELWTEAADGTVPFAGGALVVSPTPAMTLIDVDGHLPPAALALAAVAPIAATIARHELAGSIGIDFPTLADKADRRAVDDALDRALATSLAGWQHERTAMNGFGFVQIVSRLAGPSLPQRIAADRAGAAARLLLRRAEAVAGPGVLLLTCHPAVERALTPVWRDELARRTGRSLRVATDPALAPHAAFAQAVTS